MKCNRCGREFGDGLNCQHCGIDRVKGLGRFIDKPGTSGRDGNPGTSGNPGSSPASMLCFKCGEVIPDTSEYCPHCGQALFVKCPKCNSRHRADYVHCPKCGTNRVEFFKEIARREVERKRQEEEQKKWEEQQRRRKAEEQQRQKQIRLREDKDWFYEYIVLNKKKLLKKKRRQKFRKHWRILEGITVSIFTILVIISMFSPLLELEGMLELEGSSYILLEVIFGLLLFLALLFFGIVDANWDIVHYLLKNFKKANHSKSQLSDAEIYDLFEGVSEKMISPSCQSVCLKATNFLLKITTSFRGQGEDFKRCSLDNRISMLEHSFSRYFETDSMVSKTVVIVIRDREYWGRPDCLSQKSIEEEILKVYMLYVCPSI